ncbi:MAG: hypothetical protein NE327_07440 [Lentisphaeraceae bacterium]|nr:hypothetical protein [Lentisphaeraceae bacterium]
MNDKEIAEILINAKADPFFIEINNGKEIPLLTDYHLRKVPAEFTAPPEDYVGGKRLIPIFVNADFYSIYCFEKETNKIYEIDIEEPWPPTKEFGSFLELKNYLLEFLIADKDEDTIKSIRKQLNYEP